MAVEEPPRSPEPEGDDSDILDYLSLGDRPDPALFDIIRDLKADVERLNNEVRDVKQGVEDKQNELESRILNLDAVRLALLADPVVLKEKQENRAIRRQLEQSQNSFRHMETRRNRLNKNFTLCMQDNDRLQAEVTTLKEGLFQAIMCPICLNDASIPNV
ncbi:hypothetical protein VNI00_016488 [Paramarasmius palmivorus]|uniref:Uncharacterized protein n=1 Tax=Paramarasmius palmivorus TaxID=297713 RepID=A0AAW0BDM4_9AGAR